LPDFSAVTVPIWFFN